MIPTLETERLILRAPAPDDFEDYARLRASDRSRWIGGVLSREQAWRSYASVLGHWQLRGFGLWALEEKATGAWLGHVGLYYPEDWLAREVAWMLAAPEHEGRGFAREAAEAARAHAYGTLGWTEAFSCIGPENARSIALARRLGCTLEREARTEWGTTLGIWRHPGPGGAA